MIKSRAAQVNASTYSDHTCAFSFNLPGGGGNRPGDGATSNIPFPPEGSTADTGTNASRGPRMGNRATSLDFCGDQLPRSRVTGNAFLAPPGV